MTFWLILWILSKIVFAVVIIFAIKAYMKENAISILGSQTRATITHLTNAFISQVQEILEKEESSNEHQ